MSRLALLCLTILLAAMQISARPKTGFYLLEILFLTDKNFQN
jgi:hypothetical protein